MTPSKKRFPPFSIKVPATSANLGPGFDGLGLALNLFNVFRITPSPDHANEITGEGACEGISGSDNVFFSASARIFARAGVVAEPIRVHVLGGVPVARGLGSSATAIVAGVMAANEILGAPFSREELLLQAAHEEGHPDNVAPAMLGSLVAAVDAGVRIIAKSVRPHPMWRLAVLVPGYPLSTEKARAAIPKTVPHRDAVFNLTRVPLVMDALVAGHRDDLPLVLQDRLHEPYRKRLIRGYDPICEAAMRAGASAIYLSGAGPSLAAFCWGSPLAETAGQAMLRAARALNIPAESLVLKPHSSGAAILRR